MGALARLSTREKVMILTVLPLAAFVAAYYFVWQPLTAARDRHRADIAAYQQVIDTAALAGSEAVVARPVNDTPIATRITTSAETAGLPLRRIESEGAGVRVLLDDVPFAGVLVWLADLEDLHGVTASAVEFNRRPEPGIVSARLLLEPLS